MKPLLISTAIVAALSLQTAPVFSAESQPSASQPNTHTDARLRLNHNYPEPPYTQDDIEAEITFGREVASKVLGKFPALKDDALNSYVNKVGKTLAQNSNRTELNYHFVVLDSDIINAFAAPGGYIFITKGALDQAKDEAELAGILGHEIGHIEKRHYVKRVGIRSQKGNADEGLNAILSTGGLSAAQAFNEAVNQTMEILFEKGLQSKKDEYEADEVSVWLLANTGYDPTALKRYFERVKTIHTPATEILEETHPPMEDRIAKLNTIIEQNGLSGLQQAKLQERFNENK